MTKVLGTLSLSIAFSLMFCTSLAYAWPWGDSSKYRNECYQACVEDSFGKAKANEINQRCSNKCNSLPISPRIQWDTYDHCVAYKQEKYDKMIKSQSVRESCQQDFERKSKRCDKEESFLKESCLTGIRSEQPKSCADARIDEFWYRELASSDCVKPSVPRPSKR